MPAARRGEERGAGTGEDEKKGRMEQRVTVNSG